MLLLIPAGFVGAMHQHFGFDFIVRLWSGFETFCLLGNSQPIGQIGVQVVHGRAVIMEAGRFNCGLCLLGTDLLFSLCLATKPEFHIARFE